MTNPLKPVETGADTRLWCLHHIGPDDVHPAPDFATAQKWANWANGRFAEHADISRFVVAIWPWSAAVHADGLAASIAEWTLPVPAACSVETGALKVTQEARDAAASCMMRDRRVITAQAMSAGTVDNNWLIQVFARFERDILSRTAHALPGDVGGWIVGNSDGTKWRVWDALGPKWTTDRDRATRYARRVDAEQVHAEDEGAWRIELYAAALTPEALSADAGAAGPWMKIGTFYPEPDAYYLVQGTLRTSVKRGSDIDADNVAAALIAPSIAALSGDAGCKHNWLYSGTDYHGSHKGEDAYRCSKCEKIEYADSLAALPSHQGAGEP